VSAKQSTDICRIESQRTRSLVWLRVGRWTWYRWRFTPFCCTCSLSLPRTSESALKLWHYYLDF